MLLSRSRASCYCFCVAAPVVLTLENCFLNLIAAWAAELPLVPVAEEATPLPAPRLRSLPLSLMLLVFCYCESLPFMFVIWLRLILYTLLLLFYADVYISVPPPIPSDSICEALLPTVEAAAFAAPEAPASDTICSLRI